MINKERFTAMTDAIIAVAATIMVLKLDVPDHASLEAVHAQWPVLLAYAVSFTQIFLAWHEHHDTFLHAVKVNHRIFLVNCLWLFTITIIPFVTGMVGNSPTHPASLLLYNFVLMLEQLILILESRLVSKLNHRKLHDAEIIYRIRMITIGSYLVSSVCAIVVPQLSLAVIVLGCAASITAICIFDSKAEASADRAENADGGRHV